LHSCNTSGFFTVVLFRGLFVIQSLNSCSESASARNFVLTLEELRRLGASRGTAEWLTSKIRSMYLDDKAVISWSSSARRPISLSERR
jgi:hypothetical protein